MSVIAKMQLEGTLRFNNGSLSKLSCVCENDLMAAYAKADEDKLFTKYSPWGEMRVGTGFYDRNGNTQFQPGKKFYVIVLRNERDGNHLRITKPLCPGAAHVHPANVRAVHDFGNSKQVALAYDKGHGDSRMIGDPEPAGELHWRMTIDNPPAVEFFEPGRFGYWIAFYDADKFTMREALDAAHTVAGDA